MLAYFLFWFRFCDFCLSVSWSVRPFLFFACSVSQLFDSSFFCLLLIWLVVCAFFVVCFTYHSGFYQLCYVLFLYRLFMVMFVLLIDSHVFVLCCV